MTSRTSRGTPAGSIGDRSVPDRTRREFSRRSSGASPLGMLKRATTPAAISSSAPAQAKPITSRSIASSRLPRVSATVMVKPLAPFAPLSRYSLTARIGCPA